MCYGFSESETTEAAADQKDTEKEEKLDIASAKAGKVIPRSNQNRCQHSAAVKNVWSIILSILILIIFLLNCSW